MKFIAAIAIFATAGLGLGVKGGDDIKPSEKVKTRGPIVGIVPMVDYDEQFYKEAEVAAYLAAEAERIERERQVAEYLDSVYQAEQARLQAQRQTTPRVQVSTSGSGDCAGVAEIVGWGTVSRESGGNPLAENGIYKGCAQIGMPWWNGACSGLDWTNPADQAICARIVMDIQGPSAWRGTYGP